MTDYRGKSQEELIEIRRNATPGGEIWEQVSKEIDGIRQDTNNRQIASLIDETKSFNASVKSYTTSTNISNCITLGLTVVLIAVTIFQANSAHQLNILTKDSLKKVDRPYLGLVSNTFLTIEKSNGNLNGFIVSLQVKNYGSIPAAYGATIKNWSGSTTPFQSEQGYLMPGQEENFKWNLTHPNPWSIGTDDICSLLDKTEVVFSYKNSNQEYNLVIATRFIDSPLNKDEAFEHFKTFTTNCGGENKKADQVKIWYVKESV